MDRVLPEQARSWIHRTLVNSQVCTWVTGTWILGTVCSLLKCCIWDVLRDYKVFQNSNFQNDRGTHTHTTTHIHKHTHTGAHTYTHIWVSIFAHTLTDIIFLLPKHTQETTFPWSRRIQNEIYIYSHNLCSRYITLVVFLP